MDKILFISHGGKGGVGKSYMSLAAVETLLARGSQVSIVEADPTQPDLAQRYINDQNVTVGALSLNRAGDSENALAAFGEWLESGAAAQVVVNLPAGAGETLDTQGDLLRDLADSLGYRLVTSYCLEKNRVATAEMVDSFESGLMSAVAAENRFIVIPAYKGAPESFEWMDHPSRPMILLGGAREIVFPALGNRSALKKLEATPGRVAALIETPQDGWFIMDRSSVFRWYKATMAAVAPVFGGEHE
jgi:hypothetical protein